MHDFRNMVGVGWEGIQFIRVRREGQREDVFTFVWFGGGGGRGKTLNKREGGYDMWHK